jgi:hypothetical protein
MAIRRTWIAGFEVILIGAAGADGEGKIADWGRFGSLRAAGRPLWVRGGTVSNKRQWSDDIPGH